MIKILVVGQTPPPFHGQAVMIEETLKADYEGVRLYHIRMGFSKRIDDIGKFRFHKIFHLLGIIIKVVFYRFRYNIEVLYYPPAGPDKIPLFRDMILLNSTRFLFKHTIFHFRAAGVSTIFEQLSPFLKRLYKRAYFSPDIAIRLSALNPPDGSFLKAKKEFIVPNGIADHALDFRAENEIEKPFCQLLYVGIIRESKGITVLIEACRLLKERGTHFRLNIVGEFDNREYQNEITGKVKDCDLSEMVEFSGVLTGREKYSRYNTADIFCYPTFYGPESFGLSLLEAMEFSLPVVATNWRGVPSVIKEGINGFLVPVKDSLAFADKLGMLINDPGLRKIMGAKGREIYSEEFTLKRYHDRMKNVFLTLDDG